MILQLPLTDTVQKPESLPVGGWRPLSKGSASSRQIYRELEVVLEDEIAMLDQDRLDRGDYRWLGRCEHLADPAGHRHQLGREWNQHVGESGPVNVHRRQRIADEEAAAARLLLLEAVGERGQTRRDSLGRARADFRCVAVFFSEVCGDARRIAAGFCDRLMHSAQSLEPSDAVLAA